MEVRFIKRALKQLKKLPAPEQKKVAKKILLLESNSLIGKKLEGELTGSYTLRAWPYRIIYIIDSGEQVVKVTSILHRQGAYQ
ncbi:MAG TPA: type II toxin-antitoxin system RelE/ParE family toxin [Patescibacteria group bacterium]|nr:type II toxin-antitoxin system RelE/ParE family toxin [Patescibacteria group bacterium]